MEQAVFSEEPKRQPIRRRFIVILWVCMLLFSSFVIVLLAQIFLRPPIRENISSSDWSGYVVFSDSMNPAPVIRNVSASWVVPAVAVSPRNTYSDAWIGIGGQFDNSLIQTGTEQDSENGRSVYLAWYELLPNYSVTIDTLSVSPGDTIKASISLLDVGTNEWLIEIADATNGQSFSKSFLYVSSRLSAEWVVERPTINNVLAPLADFGSVTFTDIKVSSDSVSGTAADFPFSRVTMYDRLNNQLVTVSQLASGGTTFNVAYLP
jgi:hypothetical protein